MTSARPTLLAASSLRCFRPQKWHRPGHTRRRNRSGADDPPLCLSIVVARIGACTNPNGGRASFYPLPCARRAGLATRTASGKLSFRLEFMTSRTLPLIACFCHANHLLSEGHKPEPARDSVCSTPETPQACSLAQSGWGDINHEKGKETGIV